MRGKSGSSISTFKLMMKVSNMGPSCQNVSSGRALFPMLIPRSSSSQLLIHFSPFFVLSSCNSSLSGRDRSYFLWPEFRGVCVCVCVCVCELREELKKRDGLFPFILILRNKNKKERGDYENEMKNLFWGLLCHLQLIIITVIATSSSVTCVRIRRPNSPWGRSRCGQMYFSQLAQIKVYKTVWLQSNTWFFSFLAVGLKWWLVRKD